MHETRILNREAAGAFGCQLDESSEGVVRVVMTGELDLATAPDLKRALHRAHARGRLMVLDLRNVSFCDSTGLELIVRANQQAREEGRRLVIVRGPEQIQRLFALTGVEEQLEIVEDPSMATEESSEPIARRASMTGVASAAGTRPDGHFKAPASRTRSAFSVSRPAALPLLRRAGPTSYPSDSDGERRAL